jgi:DNA-binding NarL/FixJ family response regulator
LIVSGHPLFAEAITRVLQEEGIHIVATANNLAEARPILNVQEVDAIVVDHDDAQPWDGEVVSQLVDSDEKRPVIFLTLTANQMIVHHRERVENVTPEDLVRAIRSRS